MPQLKLYLPFGAASTTVPTATRAAMRAQTVAMESFMVRVVRLLEWTSSSGNARKSPTEGSGRNPLVVKKAESKSIEGCRLMMKLLD